MLIKGVTIPVSDQDRALKFYTEKLGFTVKLDVDCPDCPDMNGQRWIELTLKGSPIEVVLFTSDDFKNMIGKHMNIMFDSKDIQKTYADLKAKGVECTPPEKQSWGMFIMIKDSEGNSFIIGQHTEY